jgi:uncharacterized protein with FMN-binding domain
MLNTYEKNSKAKLITTIVAVLVVAGFVLIADHLKSETAENSTLASPSTVVTTTPTTNSSTSSTSSSTSAGTGSGSSTASSAYKDGSYSATTSYFVPSGQEQIQVSLTLKDGTVTAVSIQNSEGDRDSASFQQDFASGYKQYVVGKKISGLQIRTIAGASDTTQGFNDALSKIASTAQA